MVFSNGNIIGTPCSEHEEKLDWNLDRTEWMINYIVWLICCSIIILYTLYTLFKHRMSGWDDDSCVIITADGYTGWMWWMWNGQLAQPKTNWALSMVWSMKLQTCVLNKEQNQDELFPVLISKPRYASGWFGWTWAEYINLQEDTGILVHNMGHPTGPKCKH